MAAKLKPEPVKPGVTSPVTGGRQVEWVREASGEHQGNEHFRTIDSLGLMLRNGTITAPMHNAGQEFATVFALAHLNGPSVPTFNRIRGGQWRDSMTERVAFARKRIGQALDAVVVSAVRAARRCGTSPGLGRASRSGQHNRDGTDGRCRSQRRAASWSRRSPCWPCTTDIYERPAPDPLTGEHRGRSITSSSK